MKYNLVYSNFSGRNFLSESVEKMFRIIKYMVMNICAFKICMYIQV
jgi:hypothetical protein